MSVQWTVVAGFVYSEMVFIVLLLLPWIRPDIWSKFFKSRFVRWLERHSYIYKYSIFGLLVLLFLDGVREVRKYTTADISIDAQAQFAPQSDTIIHMRLFRAQRNLYLAGFALFLWFVIRRMIQLLNREAQLMASADASLKQGRNASALADEFRADQETKGKTVKDSKYDLEIEELRKQVKFAEKDREAMGDQVQGLKREYDRLMTDFNHLQELAEDAGHDEGDKSD